MDVRLTNLTSDMGVAAEASTARPAPTPRQRMANGLLYWVPFQGASAERWDLHGQQQAHGKQTCEATHFCHTPLFWEPLWDGISRAIIYNSAHFSAQ